MALKNILVLSTFVQMALSAATPSSAHLTTLSSRALAKRSNGLAPADAASPHQLKPTDASSDEAKPAAKGDGPPAQQSAEGPSSPKAAEELPSPKVADAHAAKPADAHPAKDADATAAKPVDAPAPKAAPIVTTNKVANEVVRTKTISNESTVSNGNSEQKNLGSSGAEPKTGEAPRGTTTVVTNKVTDEVLTTNTAPGESAARGNSPQRVEGTPAETPKAVKTNAAPGDSAATSAAPHAHSPSTEKAPDATSTTSKGTDVSIKAPKSETSTTPANSHDDAASKSASDDAQGAKDTAPKSVTAASLSKSSPASASDGAHSESPHRDADISTSSSLAGPEGASPRKIQVNIGKPATDDKADPETSPNKPPGGSSADVKKVDVSPGSAGASAVTLKSTDSHSIKPADDVFHDTDDSADVDRKADAKNPEHSPHNGSSSKESPAVPAHESGGSSLYPRSKGSLFAASILASVCVLIA